MQGLESVVLVGGGLAAAKAAEELRARGYDRRVVLVGEEHHLPYERPPLSKGYLLGNDPLESAFVHEPDWYEEQDIDLRLGEPAEAVDLAGRKLHVAGEEIGFDALVLATGSAPRRLAALDDSGVPVAYLRRLEDSQRLKDELTEGRRVLVVGAGWIGLEVAAAARAAGCRVTVVDPLELPLLRVLGREVAEVFAALHRDHDVDLRLGATVAGLSRDGTGARATLTDGTAVPADLVVVGVGVAPADALARSAGLDVDDGVLVDEHLRASHPAVLAAGDVANAVHPVLGGRVRVEHWDNAIEQGRTAARNALGAEEAYDRLPYFFTDQYDLGMEYVGHVGRDGYDEVVLRGDVAGRVFTAFWLRAGRVVAGMHVNDWDAIDAVRAIVAVGGVDLAGLRDEETDLAELAGP